MKVFTTFARNDKSDSGQDEVSIKLTNKGVTILTPRPSKQYPFTQAEVRALRYLFTWALNNEANGEAVDDFADVVVGLKSRVTTQHPSAMPKQIRSQIIDSLLSDGFGWSVISEIMNLTESEKRFIKEIARAKERASRDLLVKSYKKQGYTNVAIAKKLNISESTVRTLFKS